MGTKNSIKKAELGAKRIKYYWDLRGYAHRAGYPTYKSIADVCNVSSVCVEKTLRGRLHTKTVINALRSMGAPERMLCDPHIQE